MGQALRKWLLIFAGSKATHAKFSHVYGLTLDLRLRDFEHFTNGWAVSEKPDRFIAVQI